MRLSKTTSAGSISYIAVPGTKVPPYGRLSADDDYLSGTTDIFPSLHDYAMDGQVAKSGSLYVAVDNYLDHRIARRDALNGLDEKVISVGYMLGGITTDGIYIYVVGDSATIKYDLELNVVATGAGSISWRSHPRAPRSINSPRI